MTTRELSAWLSIVLVAGVLLVVFVTLGYWMIAVPLLVLLLAMAGGAILYWRDGE